MSELQIPLVASSRVTTVAPVMTKPRFCELSGFRMDQLRGQIQRKNIHTIKIGGQVLVNTARYVFESPQAQGLALVQCPVMTREAFADVTGTLDSWVRKQLNSGSLPPIDIGRSKAVDMAQLFRTCLADVSMAAVC